MARFLASRYKLSGLYECRGTNELSNWYWVTLQMLYKWALVQCRGTKHGRSQKFVKVQRFYLGAAVRVRVVRYVGHDIGSRKFKNRDKQMPFIVRVSISALLIFFQFKISIEGRTFLFFYLG